MVFREKNEYFETILSKYQCGFRKEFIAQHFLLTMLEQWKSAIDEKKNIWCISLILQKLLTVSPMIF